MPNMGIIASIGGQSHLSYGNHRGRNRNFLGRRSEIEANMNNEVGLRQGLAVTRLEAITMGITSRGNQTGDTDGSSSQSTRQVTQGSVYSNNRRL
jgi:hypothetical protein